MNQKQLNLLNLVETKDGLSCEAFPICRMYQIVFGQIDFRNLFFEGTIENFQECFGSTSIRDEYQFVQMINGGLLSNIADDEEVSVFYRDFVTTDDIAEYTRIPMECELFPDRIV